MHLVAVRKFYQLNTLDGLATERSQKRSRKSVARMELGEPARKGTLWAKTWDITWIFWRDGEKTLEEFRKRDDAWLMSVDKTWGWGPTEELFARVCCIGYGRRITMGDCC